MTYQKAQEILDKERDYDYIMEAHRGSNFYDFIVSIGGDVVKHRVYENGEVFEK